MHQHVLTATQLAVKAMLATCGIRLICRHLHLSSMRAVQALAARGPLLILTATLEVPVPLRWLIDSAKLTLQRVKPLSET